jgi:hypothetical protein
MRLDWYVTADAAANGADVLGHSLSRGQRNSAVVTLARFSTVTSSLTSAGSLNFCA